MKFLVIRDLREIKLFWRILLRHICSIIVILVHRRLNAAILTFDERQWIDNRFWQHFTSFMTSKNSCVIVLFNMYLVLGILNQMVREKKEKSRGVALNRVALVSFLINERKFCRVLFKINQFGVIKTEVQFLLRSFISHNWNRTQNLMKFLSFEENFK